jgi:hypothetical protein
MSSSWTCKDKRGGRIEGKKKQTAIKKEKKNREIKKERKKERKNAGPDQALRQPERAAIPRAAST